MGYLTDYTIRWEGSPDCLETIYGFIDSGDTFYGIKWYDHDEEMLKISKKYPDVTFTLDGAGPEKGDLWRAKYRDGESQRVSARVIYDI